MLIRALAILGSLKLLCGFTSGFTSATVVQPVSGLRSETCVQLPS